MQPIELRINKHPERVGVVYYTITKVWPGVANTGYVAEKFMRYAEAAKWAREHYPKIPLIRSY